MRKPEPRLKPYPVPYGFTAVSADHFHVRATTGNGALLSIEVMQDGRVRLDTCGDVAPHLTPNEAAAYAAAIAHANVHARRVWTKPRVRITAGGGNG